MFCKKCGYELGENASFCTNCGAKVTERSGDVNESVSEANTGVAEPTPEFNEFVNEINSASTEAGGGVPGAKPRKKKGKLVTILVAIIAVIAIAFGAVAASPTFKNSVMKAIKSDVSYFKYVAENNVDEFSANVSDTLDGFLSITGKSSAKEVKLEVELGEAAKDMVYDYSGDVSAYIDWLNKVGLAVTADRKDDVAGVNAAVQVNDTDVISADVVIEESSLYWSLPELSKKVFKVDISEYFQLADASSELRDIAGSIPEPAVVEDLLNRYAMCIVESVENVEEKSATVTAGDIEHKCTELAVKIDAKTVVNACKAVLTEARDDKELEKVLKNFAEKTAPDENADEIYEEFISSVEAALEEIESADVENEEIGDITLSTFVDNKGEIIGIRLTADGNSFSFCTAKKDNKDGILIELDAKSDGVSVVINGSNELKGGKLNGEHTLSVSGTDVLTLRVEDIDKALLDKNIFNGKVILSPAKNIKNLLSLTGADAEVVSMLSKSELAFESRSKSEDDTDFSIAAYTDQKLLASINFTAGKSTKEVSCVVPENYSDINDEAVAEEFGQDILGSYTKIIDNLKKAGMPQELTALIENLLSGNMYAQEDIADGEDMSDDEIAETLETVYGITYDASTGVFSDMETGEVLTEEEVTERITVY